MALSALRRSRFARIITTALAVGALTIGATGCTPEQLRIETLVNNSRTANGVPAAAVNATLETKAQNWANRLAQTCTLSHSNLAEGAPAGWLSLAENVGYGVSIEQIHDGYMRSAPHRANILNPAFNRQGGGFAPCVNRPGIYITVQEFARL